MKTKRSTAPVRPVTNAWLWTIRAAGLVAFGLSGYLWVGSLTGNRLPGCGFESGCGAVLGSRWAYWFGLPVSLFALLTYAVLLGATFGLNRGASVVRQRWSWLFLTAVGAAMVGAALWFVGLQAVVLRAFCPFCMAAHGCGLLIGMLILARAFRREPVALKSRYRPVTSVRPEPTLGAAFAGLGGALLLVTGQLIHRPDTFRVDPVADGGVRLTSGVITGNAEPVDGAAVADTPPAAAPSGTPSPLVERRVHLHEGTISLDLHQVPLLGSPVAPQVVVHLFDYSCRHCRDLHPMLVEWVRGLSNQLAIVSLPVPLSGACNRLVKRVIPEHTNACEYARTGLAVWRARPDQFAAFEDWLFVPVRPPAPALVLAEARRLVGANELEVALADPWIEEQIELGIRLLEANYLRHRRSQLPQLMVGTNLVSGAVPSVARLQQLLTNVSSLRSPSP